MEYCTYKIASLLVLFPFSTPRGHSYFTSCKDWGGGWRLLIFMTTCDKGGRAELECNVIFLNNSIFIPFGLKVASRALFLEQS